MILWNQLFRGEEKGELAWNLGTLKVMPHHTVSDLNQFDCSEQVQSDFSMTGEEFVSRDNRILDLPSGGLCCI